MRMLVILFWAIAAATLLAACEQDRVRQAPSNEAETQPANEAGNPATNERQRELERRAYDTQRGP